MTDQIGMSESAAASGTSSRPRSGRAALAFVSHRTDESVLRRFEKLEREVPSAVDVYFLYDVGDATADDRRIVREVAGDRLRPFDGSEVADSDYPSPWADPARRQLVPSNLDLLYLDFAEREPGYDRYWFVEYDVAYTGHWSSFFEAFEQSSAGLVGTTVHPYERYPDWHWWPTLDPAADVDRSEWVRGFFPIVRLSRAFLARLDEAYRSGWSGHTEAVLPTLAQYHGIEMEDVGGAGPYVRSGNENRFYTNTPEVGHLAPGTFVYRPVRPRPGFRSGRLYHPVKPDQGYLRAYTRLLKRWVSRRVLGP